MQVRQRACRITRKRPFAAVPDGEQSRGSSREGSRCLLHSQSDASLFTKRDLHRPSHPGFPTKLGSFALVFPRECIYKIYTKSR